MDISYNDFGGQLPPSLVNLSMLSSLSTEHNLLTGYIPEMPTNLIDTPNGLALADPVNDTNLFWCPFPPDSSSHVAFDTTDCTCIEGHYCPSHSLYQGLTIDPCEYNCTQCDPGYYANTTWTPDSCTMCARGYEAPN